MEAIKSIEGVREQLALETRLHHGAEILKAVADCGALMKGHFNLQSGQHSEFFIRFAQLGRNRDAIAMIAQALIDELASVPFEFVVCPESSGYFLGQAIAARSGTQLAVTAINALRQPRPALRRGQLPTGASVLVVNDVVTTGRSLEPLVDVAKSFGARVTGVATFASLRPQQFARFRAEQRLAGAYLVSASWRTFSEPECPMCRTRESVIPAAEFN